MIRNSRLRRASSDEFYGLWRASSYIWGQYSLSMIIFGLWRASSYFRCQYSIIIFRFEESSGVWWKYSIINMTMLIRILHKGCLSDNIANEMLIQLTTLLYGCNSQVIISEGHCPFNVVCNGWWRFKNMFTVITNFDYFNPSLGEYLQSFSWC